ncbi:hypothetical protein FQJ95_25725, partial [Xanthomonas vasicola]
MLLDPSAKHSFASRTAFINRRSPPWCGVLADCGTVGGMASLHERIHGVSRERRGRRALDAIRPF